MQRALVLGLLLGAVGPAGCASSSRSRAPFGSVVFGQACEVCHSLVGNESEHKQGGDLLGYRISRQALTEFTQEMPVRRPLTQLEMAAVVDYVQSAQRRVR